MKFANVLQFNERILALPIVHGSADCAVEVRRVMLDQAFDCIAVPLPPSFQPQVETAITRLPAPGVVIQRETPRYVTEWDADETEESSAHHPTRGRAGVAGGAGEFGRFLHEGLRDLAMAGLAQSTRMLRTLQG